MRLSALAPIRSVLLTGTNHRVSFSQSVRRSVNLMVVRLKTTQRGMSYAGGQVDGCGCTHLDRFYREFAAWRCSDSFAFM